MSLRSRIPQVEQKVTGQTQGYVRRKRPPFSSPGYLGPRPVLEPIQLEPTQPVPTQPVPTQPVPAQPVPAQPVPIQLEVLAETLLPAPTLDQELESINSSMACDDIIKLLAKHGCKNLSAIFFPEYTSPFPVSTGGFGDVYRSSLLDHRKVAIKVVRIFERSETGKYQKRTARELYAWAKCKHPNIVELMGLVMFRDSLAMVSRWAENGTLLSYLKKNPTVDRCRLSTLICEGIQYLHSQEIVHGDLKGDNVLISGDGTPKLNDFGSACVQNASVHISKSTTGAKYSTRWAAPELLEEENSVPTYKTDVYALGMTILETFTGNVPYSNVTKEHAVLQRVLIKKELPARPHGALPTSSISGNQLWEMMTSCWAYQPLERPTAMGVWQLMRSIEYHMLLPPLPPTYSESCCIA